MAACLRWWSTNVPKNGPSTAEEMLNAPPITPVATTERVSKYTQNVRANQRNVLVTPVISVLTSSRRKTRGVLLSCEGWVALMLILTTRDGPTHRSGRTRFTLNAQARL